MSPKNNIQSHISDALKFEWYYFDIHTNDGFDLVFTLHTKPFSSVFDIAIWDVFLYKENEPHFHHFLVRPQIEAIVHKNHLEIEADDLNYLRKTTDTIQFSVQDGSVELSMSMRNKQAGINPIETELLPDWDNGKFFKWIVLAPDCECEGSISFKGEKIDLRGRGYHDYNCGNITLNKVLKSWFWGKYYHKDVINIYGSILAKSGNKKELFLQVTENENILDEEVERIDDQKELCIKSTQTAFLYKIHKEYIVDDILFYMSTMPKYLLPFAKIRELLAHLFLTKSQLSIMKKLFTNVRYTRHRSEGVVNGQHKAHSFTENMQF